MAHSILDNIWPEWHIVKKIGQGSYGIVYEAVRTDHSIESKSAIKIISIPKTNSEVESFRAKGMSIETVKKNLQGVVDNLVNEIQIMESLKGVQNIVSVEDYMVLEKKDDIGWDIYIRMELLIPLSTYIIDNPLSEMQVIKLGMDICSALELCSKCGIIHHDIKPENIFVNQFGDFKLGDFGIARKNVNSSTGFTQTGTYYYMAPEIEKLSPYDATVDIYSLGLVMYRFMNANLLPFFNKEEELLTSGERILAVRRRLDGEQLPIPSNASPELSDIILRACSYDPSHRYGSAAEMKNALNNISVGVHKEKDWLNETMPVRSFSQSQPQQQEYSYRSQSDFAAFSDSGENVSNAPNVLNNVNIKSSLPFYERPASLIATALVIVAIVVGGVLAIRKTENDNNRSDDTKNHQSQVEQDISIPDNENSGVEVQVDQSPDETELQISADVQVDILPISMTAVNSIVATSYLTEPKYNISHNAVNVADGTLENAWVEGVNGQGIGESLTFYFDNTYELSGFIIYSGYQKSKKAYNNNSRPADMNISFSNGKSVNIKLDDYFGEQRVTFSPSVESASVTFTIKSVYPGAKYQDTAISEIYFF